MAKANELEVVGESSDYKANTMQSKEGLSGHGGISRQSDLTEVTPRDWHALVSLLQHLDI